MTDVAGQAASAVARLGLKAGDAVGEIGYDEDGDPALRAAIEQLTGGELLDEDADEVVDAVLLWWRDDDGDLTDALVDAITLLADDGWIALLTPRTGQDGYVEPAEIAEAARTAGLAPTTSGPSGADWIITRLARSRAARRTR